MLISKATASLTLPLKQLACLLFAVLLGLPGLLGLSPFVAQPAYAAPAVNKLWLSVPIFYVGDRKRAGEPTLDKKHDISCKSITYAVVHIGVPPNQWNASQLDSLRLWGCTAVTAEEGRKLTGNFNKQLTASGVTVNTNFEIDGKCGTSSAEMARAIPQYLLDPLKNAIDSCPEHQAVLFVHGCCMSKNEVLNKSAQLSAALGRPILIYDWATVGNLEAPPVPEWNSYRQSQNALDMSEIVLPRALDQIMQELDNRQVIAIAHSLGCKLLVNYLANGQAPLKFKQVHLVRPDYSLPAFFLRCGSIMQHTEKGYLYFSNNDVPLLAANLLNIDTPRAGRPERLGKILGADASVPANYPYFLDVSEIDGGHNIPHELIDEVSRYGTKGDLPHFRLTPGQNANILNARPKH